MEQRSTSTSKEKADKVARTMADITPLEPPIDSFMSSIERQEVEMGDTRKGEMLASLQTHTPPETPELPHLSTVAANVGNDPPLFSDSPLRDRSRSLSPLIRAYDDLHTGVNGSQHSVSDDQFHSGSYDKQHHSEVTAYPAILGIRNAQEALDYHRSCVEELRRYRRDLALPPPAQSSKGSRRDATSTQQISRINKSGGISKVRSISPRPAQGVATSSTPPPRKTSAPRKATGSAKKNTTPQKTTVAARPRANSERASDASQNTKKHTRAAPTKNVTAQEWTTIEDFTPATNVLDGKSHEVRWEGNKRDLTGLPDLEQLHPLEVRWASKLRLEPKQYLATKRLIFKERVAFLRQGKHFTKTAAQQVARLDVNKLSRLHEAFEAVGWLDEKHFRHFLE